MLMVVFVGFVGVGMVLIFGIWLIFSVNFECFFLWSLGVFIFGDLK